MTFRSIATLEKPLLHVDLNDWHNRVNQMGNVADALRRDAFEMRQMARQLVNETRIDVDMANLETNAVLQDRITEMERWVGNMKRLHTRISREIQSLNDEKAQTERDEDQLRKPIALLSECLTMRDRRLKDELTYDDADVQIKQELTILENNQQMLVADSQKAWEMLTRLQEVLAVVASEIEHKDDAELCDVTQLSMDRHSEQISLKPNATKYPKNACTYPGWSEHTHNVKQNAEKELAASQQLREYLFAGRERARNDLTAQQQRTDMAIRKRVFETQRVRNELQWQHTKMLEEIDRATNDIRWLEQGLHEKRGPLKLAQTRLANRTQRLGMELCVDGVHKALCEEVRQIEVVCRSLEDKIVAAKQKLNQLQRHEEQLKVELDKKDHSLTTDLRAMDIRLRLKSNDEQASGNIKSKRNFQLHNVKEEMPKY